MGEGGGSTRKGKKSPGALDVSERVLSALVQSESLEGMGEKQLRRELRILS